MNRKLRYSWVEHELRQPRDVGRLEERLHGKRALGRCGGILARSRRGRCRAGVAAAGTASGGEDRGRSQRDCQSSSAKADGLTSLSHHQQWEPFPPSTAPPT